MSFVKDVFFGGAEKRAGEAAFAGTQAGVQSIEEQQARTRGDISQFIEGGGLGQERLLEFLGLRGAEAEQAAISGFQESPGQAFLRERAERATLRGASATGGLRGGNVQQELQRQAIGLSGQFLGERLDRLAGVAGRGLTGATALGGIGSAAGANIAQLQQAGGQARSTGILGQAAGLRRGLGQVAGAFTGSGGGFGG